MGPPDERLDLSDYPTPIEQRDEIIRLLQAKNKRLRHAISPFVSFKHFIDCLCETQHEKPFTEHDCICSAMGSGGSDYIWYKDLMKAEQILEGE